MLITIAEGGNKDEEENATTGNGDATGLTVAEDIEASRHFGEDGKLDRNSTLGKPLPLRSEFLTFIFRR